MNAVSLRTSGAKFNDFVTLHSRKLVLGAVICATLSAASVQAQVQWAKRVASTVNPDDEFSIGMALDNQGNVYVTGWFDGANDFGGTTLTNRGAGGQDIFVAKFSSNGTNLWSRRAGSVTPDWNQGRGIGVDPDGNVYVAGGFGGVADFDTNIVNAAGDLEFFLAKYNSAGVVQWVRQSIGEAFFNVYGTGLAVDSAGNSYAVGYADNGASIKFGTNNMSSANFSGYSTFLVKYDSTGAVKWARLMDSSSRAYATKVATDNAGNIYVRGMFRDDLTIGNTNLTAVGSRKNMFIAKFNFAGDLTWVRQAEGGNVDEGGVGVDQAGNIYVTGWFDSTIDFGGISLTNLSSFDAFVAKYNSSGAIQWARSAAGTSLDFYSDVALDGQGNVYSAGVLNSPLSFPNGSGAIVAKYDLGGTLQGSFSAISEPASPVGSLASKVAVDTGGNVFLAGWYRTATIIGTNVLAPKDYYNFFLTKLAASALVPTNPPVIISQPRSQTVSAYSHVTFTVAATGSVPFSYRWRKDGMNLPGPFSAFSATLILPNVHTNQAGAYSLVISNAYGSVTSSPAILAVGPVPPATVVAWGDNYYGQTSVPAALGPVIAIEAGDFHTVALKNDGTVVAWGASPFFQYRGATNVPAGLAGVTAIAAGGFHTVALKNDGTIVAWGYNAQGQTNIPVGLNGVRAIAAGGYHTVGLRSNGTITAWGANSYGQASVPAALGGVIAIAAGNYHTVALKNDGTVVAWGYNDYGQTNVPPGLSGVTAVAAGHDHTVALKSDGTVVAWGDNGSGQTNVPAGLGGVIAIAAGTFHTVALKNDGTIVAWGNNGSGQANVPLDLGGVTAIAAGSFHTVALVGSGQSTAPALTVNSTGNNLTLLWPIGASAYRVESTLSLSPPITWSNVTGTFQTNGGLINIVLPMTGTQKFYRLANP